MAGKTSEGESWEGDEGLILNGAPARVKERGFWILDWIWDLSSTAIPL
jgi:hypothetical protein